MEVNHELYLIDFGLLSSYLDEKGQHIKKEKINKFRGSFLFASTNAFKLLKTSRRDDFHCLVYNMIYILDQDRLSFLKNLKSTDDHFFQKVKKAKLSMTLDDLCGKNLAQTRAYLFKPFIREVMSIKFEEAPNYEKLKFLLEKILLDRKIVPQAQYDFYKLQNEQQ